jgi:hypothetical protein
MVNSGLDGCQIVDFIVSITMIHGCWWLPEIRGQGENKCGGNFCSFIWFWVQSYDLYLPFWKHRNTYTSFWVRFTFLTTRVYRSPMLLYSFYTHCNLKTCVSCGSW